MTFANPRLNLANGETLELGCQLQVDWDGSTEDNALRWGTESVVDFTLPNVLYSLDVISLVDKRGLAINSWMLHRRLIARGRTMS